MPQHQAIDSGSNPPDEPASVINNLTEIKDRSTRLKRQFIPITTSTNTCSYRGIPVA